MLLLIYSSKGGKASFFIIPLIFSFPPRLDKTNNCPHHLKNKLFKNNFFLRLFFTKIPSKPSQCDVKTLDCSDVSNYCKIEQNKFDDRNVPRYLK